MSNRLSDQDLKNHKNVISLEINHCFIAQLKKLSTQ
jgi:hypothetical protein